MLPEWYFCSCVDATPANANAFLCAIETLESPESNDRLLYLAFDELQRMDVWMRAYALPRVLAWRRYREVPENLYRQVRSYMRGLLTRMPEDYHGSFTRLIDLLTSHGTQQSDLIDGLNHCARAIAGRTRRTLSSTPYVDLKEFLPETFILAVVAAESAHDEALAHQKVPAHEDAFAVGMAKAKAFAAAMATTLVDNSDLKDIFRGALSQDLSGLPRFGRLAFRLAARIAILVPGVDTKDGLFTRLRRIEGATFEPDLLQTAAEIIFLYDLARGESGDRPGLCDKIHRETLALEHLRTLSRRTSDESTLPIDRIFPDGVTTDRISALPVVYWQAVLWDLSLRIDSESTAAHLAPAWRPRGEEETAELSPKGPFSDNVARAWRRQLSSLLFLLGLGRPNVTPDRAPELEFEPSQESLILSPWVARRSKAHGNQRFARYEKATHKQEVLIRLVAAVAVATRLLEVLPEGDANRASFAALIAHAHDVFDMFRFWLGNYGVFDFAKETYKIDKLGDKDRYGPKLQNLRLTALALFGIRQTKLIGTGRLTPAPPELFMGMLREQESAPRGIKAEDVFYETVLPEVVMAWIADAYNSAIDPGGSSRWLGLIPEAYRYFTNPKVNHPKGETIEATLVPRFLSPDTPLRLGPEFRWQDAKKDQQPVQWRVNKRLLLLTERNLSPEDWEQKDWGDLDWRGEDSSNRASILVRELERLAAVLRQPGRVSEDDERAWRTNWMTLLNSVGKRKELDRYIRLRLLELLGDENFEGWDEALEGLELITLTLLEYGSAYELERMFEIVFEPHDGGMAETNETRRQLRVSVLRAVCRDPRRAAAAINRGPGPQDPRETAIEYQRASTIRKWLERISLMILAGQGEVHADELGKTLRRALRESLEESSRSTMHSMKGEVESDEGGKKVVWEREGVSVPEWSVRAAAYDPNRFTMSLLYKDYDLRGVDNLFSNHGVEDKYTEGQTHNVLAVLMSVEGPDRGELRYAFNCGLGNPLYLARESTNALPFGVGAYVALPIQRRAVGRSQWRIQDREGGGVRELTTSVRPGDMSKVTVREYSPPRSRSRSLDIRKGKKELSYREGKREIDLKLWDADASRCFHTFAREYTNNDVYARYGDDGKWRPVDRTPADLLLSAARKKQQVITLTLIEDAEGPSGEPAWRFSTQPGENYLIEQSFFKPDDASRIRQRVEEGDAYGLLVTVKPLEDGGCVRLSLAHELPDGLDDSYHERLTAPFDERNIQWRNLFQQQGSTIADQDEDDQSKWYYELDDEDAPAGYPTRVLVDWKVWPQTKDTSAEFKVTDWYPRNASVVGAYPGQNKITLGEDSPERFLRWWLNLNYDKCDGEVVTLKYPLGTITPANRYLTCKTDESLIVHVDADSLTMRGIRPDQETFLVRGRLAEIISVWRERLGEVRLNTWGVIDEIAKDDAGDEAAESYECIGVLLSVPQRPGGKTPRRGTEKVTGNVCKVAWVTPSGRLLEQQEDLVIENFDSLWISQGCLIEAKRRAGVWKFVVFKPHLNVRPLWTKLEWKTGMSDLAYLDTHVSQMTGEATTYAERRPGELVEIKHEPGGALYHLAVGDGLNFGGGLRPQTPLTKLAPQKPDSSKPYQRVAVSVNGELLTGQCDSSALWGHVAFSKARVKIFDKGDGWFGLRRDFFLHRRYIEQARQERAPEKDLSKIWNERLEEYLDVPRNLDATFEPRGGVDGVKLYDADPENSIKVPSAGDGTSWTSWASLDKDEGVFVVGQPYAPQKATARLFRTSEGSVLASFRRVPALTPEQYMRATGVGFREETSLEREPLYYVGSEDHNPVTGESYGETRHRFEFGYGHTLLVPERKLRFKGGEFKRKALLALYHGDVVLKIKFLPEGDDGAANESHTELAESCVLHITEFRPSLAHSIHIHRAKHKVVHILHLVCSGTSIRVRVEGFDEDQLVHGTRSYEFRKAALTEASEDRILRRFAKMSGEWPRKLLILGRLDVNASEATCGRELFFEHVRFSFTDSPFGPSLEDGERIFLQAGEIMEERNDTFLYLDPPRYDDEADFSREDIGRDFYDHQLRLSKVRLSRRHFSVRESLLRRIKEQDEQDGEQRLKGNFLLVRLSRDKSFIRANLRDEAPTRKEDALAGTIARSGGALAAVVGATKDGIRVEIEPGIFVNLSDDRIESRPADLERGDIISIKRAGGGQGSKSKFMVTNAAFADARYVPSYTRPAVLLPLNSLWNRESVSRVVSSLTNGKRGKSPEAPPPENGDVNSDNFWRGREVFSIGGLPNVITSASFYDKRSGVWRGPRAQDFVKLMETSHPKFVRIGYVAGRERAGRFRVAPLPAGFPVGSISYRAADLEAEFKPAPTCVDGRLGVKRLRWTALSFKDEPTRRIIERAINEPWQYHDSETGTWMSDGAIVSEKTGSHDIMRGPLFFEDAKGELRLRYSHEQFTKYGYPVEELINSLLRKRDLKYTYTYTVAGLSDTDIGGLWLELVPGRIVELPANRVFLKTVAGDEESLASMSWLNFAPGDTVKLRMNSSDPFKIDRIFMEDWQPGPRKAFGPRRAFLPVSGYDAAAGGLSLGAGRFKLTLPVTRTETDMREVILDADNRFEAVVGHGESEWPDAGDTVLLVLDAEGRVVVSGVRDLALALDRNNPEQWKTDPLAKWVAATPANLASLLEVVGGAMPVTVEGVDRRACKLFFSLRHQRLAAATQPGKIALTRLVGLLPDGRTAVLRCGSGLFAARMDEVVSGLPEESFEAAARFLAASQTVVWTRGEADGSRSTGLYKEPKTELTVEVLGVVPESETGAEVNSGIICRGANSQSLYWLPKASVAWTPLTNEHLRRLFPRGRTLWVILSGAGRKTPGVSMIELGNIKNEFEEMTVGQELSVRILPGQTPVEKDGALQYLAESTTTNVILLCETYDDLPGENIRVEVVRRKKERRKMIPQFSVVVTPLGKKRQSLDVPAWMRGGWSRRREVMSSYIGLRDAPRPLSEFLHVQPSKETGDPLIEKILCYAYQAAESRFGRLDLSTLDSRELSLALRASAVWLERIKTRREVYLPYAIIAVLLLRRGSYMRAEELGELMGVADIAGLERQLATVWRPLVREAVQDLGARALCSMHAEALALDWMLNPENRSRDDGLWLRLQKTAEAMREDVSADDLEAIRQFCYAVGLRDVQEDLKVIADGLMAALGELPTKPDIYLKARSARATRKLIEIYHTLPLKSRLRVQDSHAEELAELLEYITSNSVDVTLLDALPPIGPAGRV